VEICGLGSATAAVDGQVAFDVGVRSRGLVATLPAPTPSPINKKSNVQANDWVSPSFPSTELRGPLDLDAVFQRLSNAHVQAVVILSDAILFRRKSALPSLLRRRSCPPCCLGMWRAMMDALRAVGAIERGRSSSGCRS
jgi:hypothetical protein